VTARVPARWRHASRVRLVLLLALLLVATGVAVAVRLPGPVQIRDWADHFGPSFPLVFLVCHAVITVAPFPRTVLTLAAGLLFGPLTGVSIALTATTVSAVLALLLVRKLGRDAVAERLRHGALKTVNTRLAQRGWLAVTSLRLIPLVPFSVLNYCCGVSDIRLRPYVLATIVGIVAVVLLGDAITGRTSPALLGVSAACAGVGLLGLLVDARLGVKPTY